MDNQLTAKRFHIAGVVQGVGFRPFLFQLAHSYGLKGEVFNTSQGVTLTLEGTLENIENFSNSIIERKPPLASISEIVSHSVPFSNYKEFTISRSSDPLIMNIEDNNSRKIFSNSTALISPDVSVCSECLQEMLDSDNRRFNYPFINCTNCGPRYTIIKDIPYDRANTSMDRFIMCSKCQKEYDDPFDRRFHAQPNACPVCGPNLMLVDRAGREITDGESDPLECAAQFLKQGKIVALKGLGGFHIAVDAMNPDAVARLRMLKKRPHKPFALMASSVYVASQFVHISSEEEELLESYHRPILLLPRKKQERDCQIAPGNTFLGIMLPYTPLHYLLLRKGPPMLVMTSGNRGGEPISIENSDALDAFCHIADYFLLHNRDIYFRADDSIMQFQNLKPRFFRRSRGFAPLPIVLSKALSSDMAILGCGAGLKNTVCLTSGNMAFLSQHIGDLENEKIFAFYRDSISHLKKVLDIEPEIIAHDLHPGYLSTRFANSLRKEGSLSDIKLIAVQHHHAHAVSCMAENSLDGDVIAIALDGTGLGTDGNIWGGEILLCNERTFQRKAHLQYIPMPGGDAAVREPWRMALSYLYAAFGDNLFDLEIPFLKEVSNSKLDFMIQIVKKKVNTPLTSSCGRLFDAIASLCSIRHEITFESQAAMELQANSYPPENSARYDFAVKRISDEQGEKCFIIDPLPLIRELVNDIHNNISKNSIGAKFHQTVIEMFICVAEKIHRNTGIKRVVLSGGVFNNHFLLNGMSHELEKRGFKVFSHSRVPSGDGGIALGQVVIAGVQTAD